MNSPKNMYFIFNVSDTNLSQNVSSLYPPVYFSPSEAGERAEGDSLYHLLIAMLQIIINLAVYTSKHLLCQISWVRYLGMA